MAISTSCAILIDWYYNMTPVMADGLKFIQITKIWYLSDHDNTISAVWPIAVSSILSHLAVVWTKLTPCCTTIPRDIYQRQGCHVGLKCGSDWRQISVYFGSPSQNRLNSHLNSPGFVPFGGKYNPLLDQKMTAMMRDLGGLPHRSICALGIADLGQSRGRLVLKCTDIKTDLK